MESRKETLMFDKREKARVRLDIWWLSSESESGQVMTESESAIVIGAGLNAAFSVNSRSTAMVGPSTNTDLRKDVEVLNLRRI